MSPIAYSQPSSTTDANEIIALVRAGEVAELEKRFHGGRTFDELRLLAVAQTNRALSTQDDTRQREFENAKLRYLAWINFIEHDTDTDRLRRKVDGGRARLAYGEMILTQWAASDLDEFEITGGRSGHTARLLDLLLKTRDTLIEALQSLQPLADDLAQANRSGDENGVERYLIAGVYDTLPGAAQSAQYDLAWANLYIGRVDPENLSRRAESLRTAEQIFQKFVQDGAQAEISLRSRLGLAITHREQARYEEARRGFSALLRSIEDPVLVAQIRVEAALNELRCGQYDQARDLLQPQMRKDPDIPPPNETAARFYISVAHIRFANSYLLEADYLEKTAGKSAALAELLNRAKQLRETGLMKMNELAARGGAWPVLVQLYVADTLEAATEAGKQDPTLLLFAARRAMNQEKYREALGLIEVALRGKNLKPALAGDLYFERGVCHYRLNELRPAAEAFTQVVSDYPSNPRAARAVTYAESLWTQIADESKARTDYSRLADVLFALVRSFPEHELRNEALARLPAALQAAGRYAEAAEQYGNVPPYSPQAAEARFRRVLCLRLAFEAEAASLSAEPRRTRALVAVRALEEYADQAYRNAASLPAGGDIAAVPSAKDLRRWSASALVSAAEIYKSDPLAKPERSLELLADFEKRYPNSDELGRVLATRIGALRSLGRFDEAAAVVDRFLKDVPPDQAGGTLASLAREMQMEIERLESLQEDEAARRTASQSIPIFERLEDWVEAEPGREKYLDAARYGLASAYCSAGRYAEAESRVRELLAKDGRDGSYLRLYALLLSGEAEEQPMPERLAAARDAWGVILKDTGLRETAPNRWGEARYHYLSLLMLEGKAAEVENAIRQERVWRPDGPATSWDGKIDGLYEEAKQEVGEP